MTKRGRASRLIVAGAIIFWTVSALATPSDAGQLEISGKSDKCSRLRSQGGYLVDEHGRVILLRGANLPSHCYKPMKFGESDLDALQGFGFNFIRLGISWDKAEPEKGRNDLAYINSIVNFARLAGERGIYVMPEVHKYGWCQPGSDWPEWDCDPQVKHNSDFPGMMRNARRFWSRPEPQDELISFWKLLVMEFRDLDNVMGYNPLNEPLDLTMLFPGVFDRKLFAFYERWLAEVRPLDPERPACLEPSTANMLFPMLPPRFDHHNLVYAPHPYYVHGDGFVLQESRLALNCKYQRISREARKLSAPLIIGEYGGDPDTKFGRRWLLWSFELQDQYFAGAAIWVYDRGDGGWAIMDAHGAPKSFFRESLRRPYPRATSGRPKELKYDVKKRSFVFRYEPDASINAPTEIFLPRELVNGSIQVKGGSWSYDSSSEIMFIRPLAGTTETTLKVN